MLRACKHALCLTGVDPCSRVFADPFRIAAEGARPDDRVVRLDIDVAIRGVDPVYSQRPRLSGTEGRRATDGLHIFERRDRSERRQGGLTRELLARSSLEIGADQKWDPRLRVKVFGEDRYVLRRSTEKNEATHSQF